MNEFDDYTLSIEEQQAMLKRDQPPIVEVERITKDKLLEMYKNGSLTEKQLDEAITKGLITEEEKIQIILS